MAYLLVGALSILVGAAVYLVTVRDVPDPAPAMGFGDEDDGDTEHVAGPRPGYTYLQVSTRGPRLQDRILGLVGVVLLVGVSAAVLAFAIYEVGHLINETIQAFLE
ncbi:MAG: hypothetical protein L0206_05670 [Actinobacteria bacterium]|nr:hypothetical protein [Actinomycetota bacterium]